MKYDKVDTIYATFSKRTQTQSKIYQPFSKHRGIKNPIAHPFAEVFYKKEIDFFFKEILKESDKIKKYQIICLSTPYFQIMPNRTCGFPEGKIHFRIL